MDFIILRNLLKPKAQSHQEQKVALRGFLHSLVTYTGSLRTKYKAADCESHPNFSPMTIWGRNFCHQYKYSGVWMGLHIMILSEVLASYLFCWYRRFSILYEQHNQKLFLTMLAFLVFPVLSPAGVLCSKKPHKWDTKMDIKRITRIWEQKLPVYFPIFPGKSLSRKQKYNSFHTKTGLWMCIQKCCMWEQTSVFNLHLSF